MKNADKPAYPFAADHKLFGNDGNLFYPGGLTKREYFAAMAMQGILSCEIHTPHPAHTKPADAIIAAEYALIYADALLLEFEKTEI